MNLLMEYQLKNNQLIFLRNGKPLYGFKVKNPMQGLKGGHSTIKGNMNKFIQSQREYHGFAE